MKKIYALMFLFLATMAWATQEPMSKSNPVAIASDQSAIFVVFGQPTITQTFTLTATNTYTPTGSPTLTYTRTPVYTATPTLSLTPSYTPTNTIPAGTKTMTPLNTNTFTPTYTNTPSYTPTATYTPTGSATKTYTPTPSYTPTPTVNLTTVPATTTPGAFNVNPLFNSASGASDPWYDAAPQGTPTKGTGNVYDNLNSNAWSNVYGPAVLSSPTPTFTGTLTPSITPTPQNIYIAMTNTPTTNLTATPTPTATPTSNANTQIVVPVTSAGGATIWAPNSRTFDEASFYFLYSSALSSNVTYQVFPIFMNAIQTTAGGVTPISIVAGGTSGFLYVGSQTNLNNALQFGPANGVIIKPQSVPSATQTIATLTITTQFAFRPAFYKNKPIDGFFEQYEIATRKTKIVPDYNYPSDETRALQSLWHEYLYGA